MKKDGTPVIHPSSRGSTFVEKESHAQSFRGNARQPLEEERRAVIEHIITLESISPEKLNPDENMKMRQERWARVREIDVMLRNL